MDTREDKGTIPGQCHPFGALHRRHRVNPTFTQCYKLPWEKQISQVWGLDAHCNDSYLI